MEVKEVNKEERLTRMFDELITKNYITKEVKIEGINVTIRPLKTDEFLESEMVPVSSLSTVPPDVIARLRMVSTLSAAIISINGVEILEDEKDLRSKVHKLLMKLPPAVIDHLFNEYRILQDEQAKMFLDVQEKIENF